MGDQVGGVLRSGNTLFVRNLPRTSTNETLEEVFSEYGPVKSCFVVTDKPSASDPDGNTDDGPRSCRGFGYVKFSLREDAEKALKGVKNVGGKKVFIVFAKPKLSSAKDATKAKKINAIVEKRNEVKAQKKNNAETQANRLIVRNLSFKCTEEDLESLFMDCGQVKDVTIPVMDNGKKKGFAFVQMVSKQGAMAAIASFNKTAINGRPVAVDWALSKDKFLKFNPAVEQKQNNTTAGGTEDSSDSGSSSEEEQAATVADNISESGSEQSNDASSDDVSASGDDVSDTGSDDCDEEEEEEVEKDSDEEDDEEEAVTDESEDNSDDDDGEDDDDEDGDEPKSKKSRISQDESSDVDEGKTLFIRNVSFDSTEADLSGLFSKFGSVKYAKIVMDPYTDHSKGMAFVKFQEKESATDCLSRMTVQPSEFVLQNRQLDVTLAVDRASAQKLVQTKKAEKKVPKDTRNLALLKEGMVRQGTEAAVDLPKEYLIRRQKIDNINRQKIKNPNIFVSPTRLVIHNLPTSISDKDLKTLLVREVGKGARLKECRVMRDLKRVNSLGVGRSRGYAFAEFYKEEQALAALRAVNGNPKIFGEDRRPIVQFSLENRVILEKKMKKQMKSQDVPRGSSLPAVMAKSQLSAPTKGRLFPSHSGPKVRHNPRFNQAPSKKKKTVAQPTRKREPKMKSKKRQTNDDFDKLVQKYKVNLEGKKKWFE